MNDTQQAATEDTRDFDHEVALQMEEERREEDSWLETLSVSQAARFEATGELKLPEGIRPRVHEMIRRAYARRSACPWTNVTSARESGTVTGPCSRWAGHPGGCTPQVTPVHAERPEGGYPSPAAVALMVRLVRAGERKATAHSAPEVLELTERGFMRQVPGLQIYALSDEGRAFARAHVVS